MTTKEAEYLVMSVFENHYGWSKMYCPRFETYLTGMLGFTPGYNGLGVGESGPVQASPGEMKRFSRFLREWADALEAR